jgi:hypothetical protein
METRQYYHATAAFCRQRAKMEGEDERFWLAEAEILAKLATNAHRINVLRSTPQEKRRPPQLGA